jgi:hypothetical protein
VRTITISGTRLRPIRISPRSDKDCDPPSYVAEAVAYYDTQTSFLSNVNTHRLIGLASTGVTGQERWQFLEDIWTLLKIHASWFPEWVETLTWEQPSKRVRSMRRTYLPPQRVDDVAPKTRDQ